ncbi:MAG: hypothetical protein ACREVG_01925 [Burkholderiales bacterium]
MRTTLDIADDVLYAAKDFARRDRKSVGQALSEMARRGLQAAPDAPPKARARKARAGSTDARFRALGFDPLPKRGGVVVTAELVRQLMDQEGL